MQHRDWEAFGLWKDNDPEYRKARTNGTEARIGYFQKHAQRLEELADHKNLYYALYQLLKAYFNSDRDADLHAVAERLAAMPSPSPQLSAYVAGFLLQSSGDLPLALRHVERGYAAVDNIEYSREPARIAAQYLAYNRLLRTEFQILAKHDPTSERFIIVLWDLNELAGATHVHDIEISAALKVAKTKRKLRKGMDALVEDELAFRLLRHQYHGFDETLNINVLSSLLDRLQ